jgi:hypothetical protein
MPRRSTKRVTGETAGKGLETESHVEGALARRMPGGARRRARPELPPIFDEDLHVLELGSGVLLDVFINVEGRLTTFLSVDGQLIGELRVAGQA